MSRAHEVVVHVDPGRPAEAVPGERRVHGGGHVGDPGVARAPEERAGDTVERWSPPSDPCSETGGDAII